MLARYGIAPGHKGKEARGATVGCLKRDPCRIDTCAAHKQISSGRRLGSDGHMSGNKEKEARGATFGFLKRDPCHMDTSAAAARNLALSPQKERHPLPACPRVYSRPHQWCLGQSPWRAALGVLQSALKADSLNLTLLALMTPRASQTVTTFCPSHALCNVAVPDVSLGQLVPFRW